MPIHHAYTLDAASLTRSLRHVAPLPSALQHKLTHGQPITVAALGASVAQMGGCYGDSQSGKRCTKYGYGPQKGCLVSFFEVINATWPHRDHVLRNAATDATPAHMLLSCLYTLLPSDPDLIILEFGSMANTLHPTLTEVLVRSLLRMPSAPALVFLTVREFCTGNRNPSLARIHLRNETTPHAVVEGKLEAMCVRYGLSCLSYWHAVERGFYSGDPLFSRPAVARDCLHPSSGKHGNAYMTDILVHWLDSAMNVPASSWPVRQTAHVGVDLHRRDLRSLRRGPALRDSSLAATTTSPNSD